MLPKRKEVERTYNQISKALSESKKNLLWALDYVNHPEQRQEVKVAAGGVSDPVGDLIADREKERYQLERAWQIISEHLPEIINIAAGHIKATEPTYWPIENPYAPRAATKQEVKESRQLQKKRIQNGGGYGES